MAVTAVLSFAFLLGGVASSILERFPSVVQVEFYDSETWTQSCGATIVNNLYVLSAAKCFSGVGYHPGFRRIRAGAEFNEQGGSIYYVDREINHPDYVQNVVDNDITVVRLSSFLVYSSTVSYSPIAPSTTVIPLGFPVIQAGWGSAAIKGNLSIYGIFILNNSQCQLSSVQQALCGERYRIDSYNQDHGSPWYVNGIVVGVVSSNFDANVIAVPVAPHTQWIVDTAV